MDKPAVDLREPVEALLAEAERANERRLLVLAGDREAGYGALAPLLDALSLRRDRTTLVAPGDRLGCEQLPQSRASELLGTTRDAVVLDCHGGLRPNALGRVVGAVDGGGLLVVLAPPLDRWPDERGAFDESMAVPPFDVADVTGNFRERLAETLRAHPGIAIADVDAGELVRDGLTDPAPRLARPGPTLPERHTFPRAAYDACLTGDQVASVQAMEALLEPDRAVVVEADRGRGKSAAAGLAAGCLALHGRDVLVTAPEYRSAGEVFVRARQVLEGIDQLAAAEGDPPRELHTETEAGVVRFAPPVAASALPGDPDVVLVDEAAALPVRLLDDLLAAPSVGFTTTVHGYEGAGRGFDVRFRDRIAEDDHELRELSMAEPIRYAAGDPLEVWAFRALLLDASPAADQLVAGATPDSTAYRGLSPDELLADEHLLAEAFGLLVLAHYRTEPDDLARLLDAPNLSVRALVQDGHVVSVALLAREGGLPAEVRAEMYEGGRVAGNMLPDVLTSQLRDEAAGVPVGTRVMRIATHPAVRSRGLGSRLLAEVRTEFDDRDWLGTGFGATPGLVRFWADNGFSTVHLSTTRNDASGEYSVLMVDPVSDAGRELGDRHAGWFADRVGAVLSDALADADPDVVRATLRATDADVDSDLSDREWRVVADAAYGPGLFDANPGPFRQLAVKQFVDPGGSDLLSARLERLLVLRVLQARPWGEVMDELGFHSHGETMRALGRAFQPLVDAYGGEAAREQRERFDGG
jgi:tRNA(Met) cytidine acetyltransferase